MFWTGIQQLLPVICLILPITDAFAFNALRLISSMRHAKEQRAG